MTRLLKVICVAAMGTFLAASNVAVAQSTGATGISPEDMARAQSYCNSLAAKSNRSLTDDPGADLLEPSPDPASSWSQGANSMDNALSGIDLNRLTIERCRALGLR